jgi:Fungal chitosanase of glycosyl hydrolase group 75
MSPVIRLMLLASTLMLASGVAFAQQTPNSLSISKETSAACNKKKLFTLKEQQWQGSGAPVVRSTYQLAGRPGFFFTSGMTIDADGSYRAFHRISKKGSDDLANAGKPGNWWGLVTNTGEPEGKPVVQGPNDPAPGFYISQTGMEDTTKRETDPKRYVDAETIPYIVLSGTSGQNPGATFGDYAVVLNNNNQKYAYAVYGDNWPTIKIGEGSVALAKALDIPANPRDGGVEEGITYLIFPKSRTKPWRSEETLDDIRIEAEKKFMVWGGIEQLMACVK